MLSQDKKKPHMHELQKPAFLSLLFFPLGFWLAYKQKTIDLAIAIMGTVILFCILYTTVFNLNIRDYLFIFFAIGFLSGFYFLGLVVELTTSIKNKYRAIAIFFAKWIAVPLFTVMSFFIMIAKAMTVNDKDNSLIWSEQIVDFLLNDQLLLFSFFTWLMFIIYSYIRPKKLENTAHK